ncbi:hypothetical protein [Ottowia sp.]|uniref:hypothetical protein n=1 Tax=Ottowia sp. TaxID=1898956 RepID=UPI0039E3F501
MDGFAWIAGHEVQVPTLAGPRPLALRLDRLRCTLPGLGFVARKHPGARPHQVVIVRPVFPDKPSAAARPNPALRAWQRQMAVWRKRMAAS